MHDYLTREKTMLEPPGGDFVAFVKKLQQNKLKALNPALFTDSSAPAPGRIIAHNTKTAAARIFHREPKAATPPRAVSTPAPAGSQETAAAPASSGSAQSGRKSKNQGNFLGFFFTIMMLAAVFIGVNTNNQYIPLAIIAVAFLVMVIVSSRNKRKK